MLPILMALWSCGDSSSQDAVSNTKAVAGTIAISGTVMIDSDVNDINAAYASNDSTLAAQSIPNPAIVGGYVNSPGAGPQGRSSQQGDIDDYYSTTLLAGQSIRLLIGNLGDNNSGVNNLELSLFNSLGEEFGSQGDENIKTAIVSTTGEYYIRVRALSGASNYILNISLDAFQAVATDLNSQTNHQDLDIDREFVPGEIIVKFKEPTQSEFSSATNHVLRKKGGGQGRNALFEIEGATHFLNPAANVNTLKSKNVKYLKQKTLEVIKSLRKRRDVESVRPNYIRRATAIPNDPYYIYQWHYPQINLPQAWEVTTGTGTDGREVIVAVIDTGILPDHPDLQGQLVAGYDFIRDASNASDGDGIDSDPYDEGDGVFSPSTFHGTHVAGTIAGASDNGLGVAGIAWNAKVMPLRVLGKDGGTDYDIEQAIRYAAGLENDSGSVPAQRADVINLSLGGVTDTATPPEAFVLARQAGVVIVAAAGNEASNQLSYPASLEGVVSVSAVAIDKSIAFYSNYGGTIDIAAPGGNTATDLNSDGFVDGVLSTLAVEENPLEYLYAFYQGTSMAAPHVAGVIALMKAVYPDLTPQQFDQWLASGLLTEDLGSVGRDDFYGNGLIDAYKAVDVASNAAGNTLNELDPMISTNTSVLNFSHNRNELNFVVDNGGGGSLTVANIREDSNGWLSVSPVAVDSSGLGIYSATLNRASLPREVSVVTANITIESNSGTLTLPVLALSNSENYQSDAGLHYIQLINIDSGQAIKQVQAMASNGQYSFTMDNVPFGNYILVAGSNPDNNGLICGVAEACGEYPRVGLVEEITINDSSPAVTIVNFETNFNQIAIVQGQRQRQGHRYLP
ncbi:S8 family peptidase [Kaarinaea lacus]